MRPFQVRQVLTISPLKCRERYRNQYPTNNPLPKGFARAQRSKHCGASGGGGTGLQGACMSSGLTLRPPTAGEHEVTSALQQTCRPQQCLLPTYRDSFISALCFL